MKKKKYHAVETASKSDRNIIERGKIDTSNTHIHDVSISPLGTGTSTKSGGVKLALWAQTFPPSKMMRSCKCFPYASKMPPSHINGRIALL